MKQRKLGSWSGTRAFKRNWAALRADDHADPFSNFFWRFVFLCRLLPFCQILSSRSLGHLSVISGQAQLVAGKLSLAPLFDMSWKMDLVNAGRERVCVKELKCVCQENYGNAVVRPRWLASWPRLNVKRHALHGHTQKRGKICRNHS